MNRKPIADPAPRVRQRQRADGSWRVWWEPETEVKALGFSTVELDAGKVTWSQRQAAKLNADVDRARATGGRVPQLGARTMDALIAEYQRSDLFTRLAPKTQADYRARMRLIGAKWGPDLVTSFSKPVLRTWYETLQAKSGQHQAVAMLRSASILFSFAELRGWRAEGTNPCLRLKMQMPQGRSRASSWAEYDALIAAAHKLGQPAMAVAIALSGLHGQRQTDVRLARIDGFQDATVDGQPRLIWLLTRQKRGTRGAVPIHPDAEPAVRALIATARPDQVHLLLDAATGAVLSEDLFQSRWQSIRLEAAKAVPSVASLQFRDLRRSFGIWARAGGATVDDVGNVLGNSAASDPQLEEIYMPPSLETTARAVASVQRPKGKKVSNG